MPVEGNYGLPTLYVPQLQRVIRACAGQPLPIWRESQIIHTVRMPSEGYDWGSALHVPQLDALIIARAGQPLASGRKKHHIYTARVSSERGGFLMIASPEVTPFKPPLDLRCG